MLVLLAPFDPTQKGSHAVEALWSFDTLVEFLSKEQNEIKRSLFNLGLMVDIMNKQTASIGFSWRSTKLTKVYHIAPYLLLQLNTFSSCCTTRLFAPRLPGCFCTHMSPASDPSRPPSRQAPVDISATNIRIFGSVVPSFCEQCPEASCCAVIPQLCTIVGKLVPHVRLAL
jgi:hypothetical protein